MNVKIFEKVVITNPFKSIVHLSQLKNVVGHRSQINSPSVDIDEELIVHRLKSMEAKFGKIFLRWFQTRTEAHQNTFVFFAWTEEKLRDWIQKSDGNFSLTDIQTKMLPTNNHYKEIFCYSSKKKYELL